MVEEREMLNSNEVSNFLENVIFLKNWEILLKNNKLEFLRKFIRHFVTNLYFQNITLSSVSAEQRRAPTLSEVVKTGLSGKGGVCVEQNYFAKVLLRFLGFDCFCIQGTYPSNPIEGNHCAVIVRLSNDEDYLVDVGQSLPGLDPIPIRKLPFNFQAGGLAQQWRLSDKGTFKRYQLGGKLFRVIDDDKYKDSDELRVELFPEPKVFEDYNDSMIEVFTNPKRSLFLRTPFLFRYLDNEDDQDDDSLSFVYIWGTTLLVGNAHSRQIKNYENLREISQVIKKYFPKLDELELESAIAYYEDVYKASAQAY